MKRFKWLMILSLSLALLFVACSSEPETVEVTRIVTEMTEVTRVVTETVVEEGEEVEVTRVIVEQVEVEVTRPAEESPPPAAEPIDITIIQGVDPASLDPQVGEAGPKANVLIHIFDYLTAIDDNMGVVLQAAESMEVMEDGLTWRFTLRDDINFWNGEPLDANAVKFTIDRITNEELRAEGLNDAFASRVDLDEVVVVDDYTVDIITKSPQPLMGMWLSFLAILEPTHYADLSLADASINPMGSGAFRFVEWVKDDHILLERNPDWWDGRTEIDTITFRPVPEASVRLSELETGSADLVTDLKPEDISRVALLPDARIAFVEGGRRIHIGFNVQRDYFKDPKVRQAFNYAIDWDEISTALFAGLGSRSVSASAGWVPDDLEAFPYDPDLAVQMLEEAGYPFDQPLTLNTPNGRYLKDVEISQAVAAQLGRIGIQVEVVPLEWTVMLPLAQSQGLEDLWLLGYGSRLNGLQDMSILSEGEAFNPGGYQNFRIEELLAEANSYLLPEEQMIPIAEAQRVAQEDPPWIFLYRQLAFYGTSDRLGNWVARPDERIRLDHYHFD
jgi:peptide/nickel transport system substrate-binding protein